MNVDKKGATAAAYLEYQKTVSSRLRYRLAIEGISRLHDIRPDMKILDAAGGNGLNALHYARRGHDVTLLDRDAAMIDQARRQLTAAGLVSRCNLLVGTLEAAPDLVPAAFYDLILLHHVIEYLEDVPHVLALLRRLASDGGELSMITLNPVSEVIRAIVFKRDVVGARAKLTDLRYDARWFGDARLYSQEQVVTWAEAAGWRLEDFRGMRVLSDYIPDTDLTPSLEDELTELEIELGGREPYRRFGRYLQFRFKAA